jgi:hypothetical protein|tara:strand:- start:422 stop:883 length:462 start_codon:yes stop_codon:yes gene_type:complete
MADKKRKSTWLEENYKPFNQRVFSQNMRKFFADAEAARGKTKSSPKSSPKAKRAKTPSMSMPMPKPMPKPKPKPKPKSRLIGKKKMPMGEGLKRRNPVREDYETGNLNVQKILRGKSPDKDWLDSKYPALKKKYGGKIIYKMTGGQVVDASYD